MKVPQDLLQGTVQGIQDALAALVSTPLALPSLSHPFAAFETSGAAAPQGLVNILSSVTSTDYGVLLPTADILNCVVTTLPAYDVTLVVDGLQSGDLLSAIGDPIAADFGLASVAGLYEIGVIVEAVHTTITDLAGLLP